MRSGTSFIRGPLTESSAGARPIPMLPPGSGASAGWWRSVAQDAPECQPPTALLGTLDEGRQRSILTRPCEDQGQLADGNNNCGHDPHRYNDRCPEPRRR
jgi:hypothetical protein